MTLLRISPLALSRSRFALSPLAETLGAMRVLVGSRPDPWLSAWHRQHAAAFRAKIGADYFAAGLVGLLTTTTWLPEFVTIAPPGGMRTALGQELALMRRFPDAMVRAELEHACLKTERSNGLNWLDGEGWAARSAELFSSLWIDHVLPDWPRRRALLEREVTYRAGMVTAYGWSNALANMNRRSAWVGDDAIRFSDNPLHDRLVGDEGILFVPVSLSRGSWLCETRSEVFALVYPARGVAAESDARLHPGHARALGKLLGTVRARILLDLERAATTSELAAEFGLSVGTIGDHLAVLRDVGLVEGTRVGRRVVYRRTDSGDRLTGSSPSWAVR